MQSCVVDTCDRALRYIEKLRAEARDADDGDTVTPDRAFDHARDLLAAAFDAMPNLVAPFMSPMPDTVDLTWKFMKDGQREYFMIHVEADGTLITGRPPSATNTRRIIDDLSSMQLVPFGPRNADGELVQDCE